MIQRKILLTDGLWRKSLVALRALGKNGYHVTVTGTNLATTSFYSKYCSKKIITPDPSEKPKEFAKCIISELEIETYQTIFVMEEASLKALLPYRSKIEELTDFPFPESTSLKIAFSKTETQKLAKKVNIKTPYTATSLSGINKKHFPLVAKPEHGSGSRGIYYLQNIDELNKLQETHNLDNYLFQKRIPREGTEVGVNLLFNNQHQVVAQFSYKRLRDYPVSGGPSTLRESTNNPQIISMAKQLLQKLNWVGIAMVEFKQDPKTKEYLLLEINPRFWGSLALSVNSGVNFPNLLIERNEIKTPVTKYKVHHQTRWLIPGDILHFLSNPKRFHLQPSFFKFAGKNLSYDDFDSSDIKGNFAHIICTAVNSFNPKMWKLAFRNNNVKK